MHARAMRLTLALMTLLGLLGSALFIVPVARAAPINVTNLNDNGAGSLRKALADAAAAAGPDTIEFQAGLTGTITLASTLTINQDVTITGPGSANLAISGNGARVIFSISGGTSTISGVKLTKGSSGIGAALDITGGSVTLSDTIVSDNFVGTCCPVGGSIAVRNGSTLTLNNTSVTANAGGTYNLPSGIYANGSTVTLKNSTVSNNSGGNPAPVVATNRSVLNLDKSAITGNTAVGAGGLLVDQSTLVMTASTISGNTTSGNGGGLSIANSSSATITNSTINGNKAGAGTGGVGITSGSTATFLNSTISGNTAATSAGGLYVAGSTTEANLRFVTLTGNVADQDNDGSGDNGGIQRDSGVLNIQSSIVAGNIDKGGQKPDCGGTVTSQGNNLFGSGTGCPANGATDIYIADINAVLNATLANNGGPTQTHALVAGSPAVGAGSTACTGYTCPTTDQRGVARPQGARADIGAYEAEGSLANPAVTRALNISVSGSGAIAVQPGPNAAGGRYNDGTSVTLRATANSGSQFVGWTLNGAPGGNINPLTLTMNADQTVVANFSPLPPPPSFADVPVGYWAHDQIIAFAQRGITTGCDTDPQGIKYYCPERLVTRAEMAAFIIRTLTGTTAAPAGPATPTFADVPTNHPQYGYIEALVARGITTGCGGGDYCPDRRVTRAEMAAFIIRAKTNQTAAPAGPATPTFADVPANHPQYGFIEAMYSQGITTGCGDPAATPKNYCPGNDVTRAEMAVFIIRAYP